LANDVLSIWQTNDNNEEILLKRLQSNNNNNNNNNSVSSFQLTLQDNNHLLIRFESDQSLSGSGFQLQYDVEQTSLLISDEKDDSIDIGLALVLYLAAMVLLSM
jgi:hypothetical protein